MADFALIIRIRSGKAKRDERIEERPPKYELIGIHTGRRIFIVNTLSLGIPPNAVMKWTDTTTTSTRQCFRILISWTVD